MKKALAVMAVLAIASIAHGALVMQAENMGAAPLAGYTMWEISIVQADPTLASDPNYAPNAFAGSINGPMLQAGNKGNPPLVPHNYTPTIYDGFTNADMLFDSHFLFTPADVIDASAPNPDPSKTVFQIGPFTEDNDFGLGMKDPVYNSLDMGIGSELKGTMAFSENFAGLEGPKLAFAWLVVPDGQEGAISFNGKLASQSGGEEAFDNMVVIPEPATMSLLALGGLAGLIRRRR